MEIHNELFAGYDCCKCNNCCRVYSTSLAESEINLIAAFLGIVSFAEVCPAVFEILERLKGIYRFRARL